MRVLVLGGAGRIGAPAARLLADRDAVTEIAIAGRDEAIASRVASELGAKARGVRVDVLDEGTLASLAAEFDVIVNAAGPDYATALPVARAAIAAKTHACDIAADGHAVEELLALDEPARAAGVTVLSGIGHVPGLSNLLMLRAARMLDVVDEVTVVTTWAITRAMLAAIGDAAAMRASGRVTATWPQIVRWATGPVLAWRDGARAELRPRDHEVELVAPDGAHVRVFPIGSTEPVTFPRALPSVRRVTSLFGLEPAGLGELLHATIERALPPETAALEFLEAIAADPDRWLGPDKPRAHRTWATAIGTSLGQPMRVTCRPARPMMTTAAALAGAALAILGGDIPARGVLSPESCLGTHPAFALDVRTHIAS